MESAIRALVATDAGVRQDVVRAALPVEGEIQIVGIVEGLDEAWKTLQEAQTDLLVIACSGYSERALFLIENAVKQNPMRPVVVLCEASPNGFLRRVFEAGADDIVGLPESSETVLFALQKAVARKLGTTKGTVSLAPMICVLGPKGGTGKTLVATNLGVSLAKAGKRVTVIDLDLQFGDVALALGLAPDKTLYDLARSGGSIDGEKIEAYLERHESGLRVLLAPNRPDQASAVSVEFLREVYAALRAANDFVIVDTPPGFTPEVIASIDSSTDLIVVGMLDSLSLKNTKLGLETLDLMAYEPTRIRVVLNRSDSRVGISGDDVKDVIGRPPDVLVPSDRDIPRALNEGRPIVTARGHSEAARAFRVLADLYLRRQAESVNGNGGSTKPRSRRLLGRR